MQTHLLNPAYKGYEAKKARKLVPDVVCSAAAAWKKHGVFPERLKKKMQAIAKATDASHASCGYVDRWHGLLDGQSLKPLKFKLMTRSDARARNSNLAGTGFSWAQCNPPS